MLDSPHTTTTYFPRTWDQYIPGTNITRAEFLLTMRSIWDSPLSKYSAFLSETLRKLTEPGILNATQIAILTGHSVSYVYDVANLMGVTLPRSRARFNPEMIPLLQTCLVDLAQGNGIRRDQLEVLSKTVGPKLVEALIGIPAHAGWHAKAKQRDIARIEAETESW